MRCLLEGLLLLFRFMWVYGGYVTADSFLLVCRKNFFINEIIFSVEFVSLWTETCMDVSVPSLYAVQSLMIQTCRSGYEFRLISPVYTVGDEEN